MRFVIPAGPQRRRIVRRAGWVAGVLFLGWLSGFGAKAATSGQISATAEGFPPARRPAAAPPRQPQSAPARRPAVPAWLSVSVIMSGGSRTGGAPPSLSPRFPRVTPARPTPPRPAVDCRVAKCVALTFDDGPGPYTDRLLRVLAAHHARATFFLIGQNIRGRQAVVRREIAGGHAVGDHTWTHPDLSKMSDRAIRSQLTRTFRAIHAATGGSTHLMRPPYGATNGRVGRVARTMDMSQILWSVDTNDWLDRDSAIVAHRGVSWVHRGDIVLMHDIHPTTVRAVPKILDGLAGRGFTFVTVPELLGPRPLKPGRVYSGGG